MICILCREGGIPIRAILQILFGTICITIFTASYIVGLNLGQMRYQNLCELNGHSDSIKFWSIRHTIFEF